MRFAPAVTLVLGLLPGAASAEEAPDLPPDDAKLGYSVGYQVGDDFRRQGIQIDPELLARGLMDALEGSTPRLTPDEMRRALTGLQQRAAASQQQQRRSLWNNRRYPPHRYCSGRRVAEGTACGRGHIGDRVAGIA